MSTCFQILKDIEKFLALSGIVETRLQKLRNLFEILSDESEVKYRVVIDDVLLHEYREFQEIWNLVPEHQWQMYEDMGIVDLREQLLLFYAKRNLKNAFILKVCKYGRKKKNRHQDFEEDS